MPIIYVGAIEDSLCANLYLKNEITSLKEDGKIQKHCILNKQKWKQVDVDIHSQNPDSKIW